MCDNYAWDDDALGAEDYENMIDEAQDNADPEIKENIPGDVYEE